jgi:hypothetical protein
MGSPSSEKFVASELTNNYALQHTYMPSDAFTCSDMAIDLWNMMRTSHIDAYIAIGNLDSPERPVLMNATHAWVLARFKGTWVAFEPQTGETIYLVDDNRYFNAFIVNDSTKVKEFYAMYGDYKRAEKLYDTSKAEYEAAEKWYYENAGNMTTLNMDYVNARVNLEAQHAVYKVRENDLAILLNSIDMLETNLTIIHGG